MQGDHRIVTEIFYDGAWRDISADVRDKSDVVIERGSPDESGRVRTGSLTFALNNGRSNVAELVGRYTPRNPRSDLFGKIGRNTPVRQSIEGHQRFSGEISEWPTRWGLAGDVDVWVTVKAYGILRRLGQGGGKPAQTALKRRLLTVQFGKPVAFWPLDEGELVNVGQPLIGSSPFQLVSSTIPYYQFDRSELAPWIGSGLKIVPDATSTGQDIKTFRGANVGMPAAVTEFSCEWFMRYGDGPTRITGTGANSAQTRMVLFGPPGPSQQVWTIQTDNFLNGGVGPGLTVSLVVGGVTEFSSFIGGNLALRDVCDGQVHHMHIRCSDAGATAIFFALNVDNKQVLSFQDNAAPVTLQGVDAVEFRNVAGSVSAGTAESPAVTIGHVALRHTVSPPFGEGLTFNTTFAAGSGHFGESAGRRIERLCAEEGIPFGWEGDLSATEPLGHQQVAPILKLLEQAVTADGGILYESRDSPIQNLLVGSDGTFEDGLVGPWTSPLAENTVTNAGSGHTGFQTLKIERTTSLGPVQVFSNGTGVVARPPVVAGQVISASLWANSIRAGQVPTPDARVRLEYFDVANASLGVTEGTLTSLSHGIWTWLAMTTTVPSGAATVRVGYASGNIGTGDWVHLDDVFVVSGVEPVRTKQFGGGGLVYATIKSLYNRTPVLALDYRDGHISPPFDPVDDDQGLVNDATVRRINGGERRFVKAAGPLSIAPPPAGVGRYDRRYDVNVDDDDRPLQHAAYRVEFGTFDESRYPEVGFRVLKHAGLITEYVKVDSGSWITIDHPPAWLPPEQIGCMVTGYVERYSRSDWSCKWWTIPSGLYLVGVVGIDRLDTEAATVNATFVAGTDSQIFVAFAGGAALAEVGNFEFDIRVAGVVLHVFKVENAASPQTFNVIVEPVNGVKKTIPAGTPVRLAKPWRLAL